jgi:translocator protein
MNKLHYVIAPLAVVLVAICGSLLTSGGMTWYDTLSLPNIAPPGSFIGLVWTIIFILSAIAIVLWWGRAKRDPERGTVLGLFIANGLLNVGWSGLWFGLHQLGWGIVEMTMLNLTTLLIIVLLWKRYRASAWLLMPYLVWVTFATYLAFLIWRLN